MIKTAQEGSELYFPITVYDENKPEKLDSILPVMGTPVEVELKQYIPDLKWESSVVEQDSGGIVVSLVIKGREVEQSMLLNSDDPKRQTITSVVGGARTRL